MFTVDICAAKKTLLVHVKYTWEATCAFWGEEPLGVVFRGYVWPTGVAAHREAQVWLNTQLWGKAGQWIHHQKAIGPFTAGKKASEGDAGDEQVKSRGLMDMWRGGLQILLPSHAKMHTCDIIGLRGRPDWGLGSTLLTLSFSPFFTEFFLICGYGSKDRGCVLHHPPHMSLWWHCRSSCPQLCLPYAADAGFWAILPISLLPTLPLITNDLSLRLQTPTKASLWRTGAALQSSSGWRGLI